MTSDQNLVYTHLVLLLSLHTWYGHLVWTLGFDTCAHDHAGAGCETLQLTCGLWADQQRPAIAPLLLRQALGLMPTAPQLTPHPAPLQGLCLLELPLQGHLQEAPVQRFQQKVLVLMMLQIWVMMP